MEAVFDVKKIVIYLNQYKNDLHILYNWNAKIEKLLHLGVLDKQEIELLNKLTPYDKEIRLKFFVGNKLNSTYEENYDLFLEICLSKQLKIKKLKI